MPPSPSPTPYFDLEFFLQTAGETRLGGEQTEECLALWQAWSNHLSRVQLTVQGRSYLALWLDGEVEKAVDAAWEASPSRGFRLNALAQTLCMCAIHEAVPEIQEAGCAPLPHPDPDLASAITAAGLPARAAANLELGRRYAVVTRAPFAGACDICALQATCPRAGGTGIELGVEE